MTENRTGVDHERVSAACVYSRSDRVSIEPQGRRGTLHARIEFTEEDGIPLWVRVISPIDARKLGEALLAVAEAEHA